MQAGGLSAQQQMLQQQMIQQQQLRQQAGMAGVSQLQQQQQLQQMQIQMQQQQLNQMAQKRAMAGAPGMADPKQARTAMSYTVHTSGADGDEVVIKTLVGEYNEVSSNHQRKVFQKQIRPGASGLDGVEVFLYYWDGRDGPSFQGWWFGHQVGGTQVWSHCQDQAADPPANGWKIPWDGVIRPTLHVTAKQPRPTGGTMQMGMGAMGGMAGAPPQSRVKEADDLANNIAQQVSQALASARKLSTPEAGTSGADSAEEILTPQLTFISDAERNVQEMLKVGGTPQDRSKLIQKLGNAKYQINQELQKLRQMKQQHQLQEQKKIQEEQDAQQLEIFLQEIQTKMSAAEDLTLQAVAAGEVVSSTADDAETAKQAVETCEAAVKAATNSLAEVKALLGTKQIAVRKLRGQAQQKGQAELMKLTTQITQHQQKLTPLKAIRQKLTQLQQAVTVAKELEKKLITAEGEIQAAAAEISVLQKPNCTEEEKNKATLAQTKAQAGVNSLSNMLDQKMRQLPSGKDIFQKLQARVSTLQDRINKMKEEVKEAVEKIQGETIVKETREKLKAAEDAVQKALKAEKDVKQDVESLPVEEALKTMTDTDQAMKQAVAAVSSCKMHIMTKSVETKRFVGAHGKSAAATLAQLQTELDIHQQSISRLKENSAGRKQKIMVLEIADKVAKAEESVAAVEVTTKPMERPISELTQESIKEARVNFGKAGQVAEKLLQELKKLVSQKQLEAKSIGSAQVTAELSSALAKKHEEVAKLQDRMLEARKTSQYAEARLIARKVVEEVEAKMKDVDEKMGAVENALSEIDEDADAEGDDLTSALETVKVAETAAGVANGAVFATSKIITSKMSQQKGPPIPELTELGNRDKAAREKLEKLRTEIKHKSEKLQVKDMVKQAAAHAVECDELLTTANTAEEPFMTGVEDLPIEQASAAIDDIDVSVQKVQQAVGTAKGYIAMKVLAVKRFAKDVSEPTTKSLTETQERLDKVQTRFTELRTANNERKRKLGKELAKVRTTAAEEKVELAVEAAKVMQANDKDSEVPKEDVEKAVKAQLEATKAVDETRSFVLQKQREMKSANEDVSEMATVLGKLQEAQKKLDKQKPLLAKEESKFIAKQVLEEANELLDKLEKETEAMKDVVAPFISDDPTKKEDFVAAELIGQIHSALQGHLKEKKLGLNKIFDFISGNSHKDISKDNFLAFMDKLPATVGSKEEPVKDLMFTSEQINGMFKRFDSNGDEKLSREEVQAQFLQRYKVTAEVAMTDGVEIKTSTTVRKLKVGEIVEQIGTLEKDEGLGLTRMNVKAAKDEQKGWVTLESNKGTKFLVPFSAYNAKNAEVEAALGKMGNVVNEATKFFDQKSQELRKSREAPMMEASKELNKLKGRLEKSRSEQTQMRTQFQEVGKTHSNAMAIAKRQMVLAQQEKFAKALLADQLAEVDGVEKEASKLTEQVPAICEEVSKPPDDPAKALKGIRESLEACCQQVQKCRESIKQKGEEIKANKQTSPTAKMQLFKLNSRLGATEESIRTLQTQLNTTVEKVETSDFKLVKEAVQAEVLQTKTTIDTLFQKLSPNKEGKAPFDKLTKFVNTIKGIAISKGRISFALKKYESGVSRLAVSELAQQYHRCTRDIAMTADLEILKTTKTLKKLHQGDIVEVLSAETQEEGSALVRVKARAVKEDVEGWLTVKGNAGSSFLEPTCKPYYCMGADGKLTEGFDSDSSAVEDIAAGSVIELLSGPKEESGVAVQRVRVKCTKDGKTGWATHTDSKGKVYIEVSVKLLTCQNRIAITDSFNITESKVVRKLDVGENVEILEGPQTDEERKLERYRIKCCKDNVEGWVTKKGSMLTEFLKNVETFSCVEATSLESTISRDSNLVRMLEVDESLEILDGPKTETSEKRMRVQCRVVGGTGKTGWTTLRKSASPWHPLYKCLSEVPLRSSVDPESAEAVRSVEAGETLEALSGPMNHDGFVQVYVRAERDGAVGFIGVRAKTEGDKPGQVLLENVVL